MKEYSLTATIDYDRDLVEVYVTDVETKEKVAVVRVTRSVFERILPPVSVASAGFRVAWDPSKVDRFPESE